MDDGQCAQLDPRLRELLDTYARSQDREPDTTWHDRVMELPGLSSDELSRLHGTLIARGWVDVRVGPDILDGAGRLQSCYRLLPAGREAIRSVQGAPLDFWV